MSTRAGDFSPAIAFGASDIIGNIIVGEDQQDDIEP
jgi:hypothetical protein